MCHQLVVSVDGGARQEGRGPSQVAWKGTLSGLVGIHVQNWMS